MASSGVPGSPKVKLTLTLLSPDGRDRAGRDLRAQQVIPGIGQEGVALDEGGLLVRGFASGYLPRFGGGIEQAEQLGETMLGNAPPRSA